VAEVARGLFLLDIHNASSGCGILYFLPSSCGPFQFSPNLYWAPLDGRK